MRWIGLLLLIAAPAAANPLPSPIARCRAAVATAEREAGIPAGLLAAISRVESSHRDPVTGETGPYPWTVNVEGVGRFFPSAPEVIAHVRQSQAAGSRSIDIGCMQINLRHHPTAFASLEEGFDPLTNARYAARFLKELHARAGDWLTAAGHYHSQTPARAEAYRTQVALRWPEEQARAGAAPGWNPAWPRLATGAVPAAPAPVPASAPVPSPAPAFAAASFGSIRGASAPVVFRAPGGGGMTGRDLDSYRGMAIPLAGPVAGRIPALVRPAPGLRPGIPS